MSKETSYTLNMIKKEKLLEALRELEAKIDGIVCEGGTVRASYYQKLQMIRRKIWELDGTFVQ